MFLSIIIATINRYADLVNTISDLEKQTFQDFEILIIDQTKDVPPPLFTNPKIRYFKQDELSASKARNTGISQATGKILLFIDDDVKISNKQFLQSYVTSYVNNPQLAGVTGPVLSSHNPELRNHRHWLSRNNQWGWLFFPPNYGITCMLNSAVSCNMSVRRKYAIDVGGMDENYVKGAHREESDFNERLTKRYGPYLYNTECALWHIGNPNGGIRTWKETKVKPQHHFDSSWYFLFRNVRLIHYPQHLFSMGLFFVVQEKIMFKPKALLITLVRCVKGFIHAVRLIRKQPKTLAKKIPDAK